MRRSFEFALGLGLALMTGQAASNVLQPHAGSAAAGAAGGDALPNPHPPDAPALAPVPPPEPIGERYDDDAALPTHADEVASYTLRVTLDPVKHDLHGEGTIVWKNGVFDVQAGAGVVADSIPAAEYEETMSKAKAMLKAVEIAARGF